MLYREVKSQSCKTEGQGGKSWNDEKQIQGVYHAGRTLLQDVSSQDVWESHDSDECIRRTFFTVILILSFICLFVS